MKKQNTEEEYKGSTFKEKLSYGIGDAAGGMLIALPGSYLTVYCTDSLALGAAFVGTMMVICRILDGISDIIMGMIIEKTNTKWGKARPWFVVSIVPLIISFIALFNTPRSWESTNQIIYIYVMYILGTVVFYTINNIGYHAMLPRFSLTAQDRGAVSSVRAFMCIIFITAINVVIPILIPILGGEASQRTWTTIVFGVGFIALICYSITAFVIKEKIPCKDIEKTNQDRESHTSNSRQALKFLVKDKHFYILIFVSTVWFITMNVMGIHYYYARDVLGNGAITGMLSMACNLPALLAMPVIPTLFRKYGQKKVIVVGLVISAVASAAILFVSHNLTIVIILLAIRGITTAPQMAGVATMASDLTEYTESKIGIRTEGLATSAYSVGVKLGTGLGGAFVAWELAIGGYNYMLDVQTKSTQNVIIFVFAALPAICYVLGAVMINFWNINKRSDHQEENTI